MSELTDVSRKLVAVFAADVEGYSRLMGTDEVGTLRGLTERRAILDRFIGEHRGRIANTAGDSVLAEFGSAVDAVKCAVDAQTALAEVNSSLPSDRRIDFRIGVHIGDVMIRAGDLFGDGVNIAARLQTLAKPGAVCISSATHDQVRKVLPMTFEDLGAQRVKNLEEPIRAFTIISGDEGAPTQISAQQASAPHLSMVVLPFANIGGGPDQDYFVDGVTESLTTDLSRIAGAFVIARNTAFTLKNRHVDVKVIGRELNVRYVLEGSVQRGDKRFRVNVQLIDAETGTHLWAERFDKPTADLFDMQDEIVSRLANTLGAELIAAEARRAEHSLRPDVMDLVFQGRAWWNKGWTPDYMARARRFFEQAIALDAGNVEAIAGLAAVDVTVGAAVLVDDRAARFASAEAALTKVLSLAPHHVQARLALGGLLMFTKRTAQAITELEHALALDSNAAGAHGLIGFAKHLLGRSEETEAHINEALRLSPRDTEAHRWFVWVGIAKVALNSDVEAIAWLRRGLDANRNFPMAHFHLAAVLARRGEMAEARAAAQAGLGLDPGFTTRRFRAIGSLSDHPAVVAGRERQCEGLRLAGVPEG